ncbi:histidine kinase [Nonomuraea sp. NPDC050404]|uniref:sensor histidine kinase n=1 Tax=Nonomuraea sp. NPDC050404 TaxID=3155783 RepID=UPI003410791C
MNEARRATAFLVLTMAAFMLLDLALYRGVQRTGGPLGPAAGLVLSLVVDACLPLLGRFPRAVALVASAATAVAAVGDTMSPGTFTPVEPVTQVTAPLCTPVIVWFLVQGLARREALAYVTVLALAATRPWTPDWETVYGGITATVLPALLGLYIRARRELVASLRDRAESAEREGCLLAERAQGAERERRLLEQQARGAERERRLLAERAKAEERQRLAGEMHDIVTHHVTEIVLAAGALKVSTGDRAVRGTAEHIRDAGARTLTELRDLIGILRNGHDPIEQGPPDRPDTSRGPNRPDPPDEPGASGGQRVVVGAADLDALVESAVAAGNPAVLRVTGRPGAVTPAIARAAYRVLQEALTNVRKHAPATAVEIELAYEPRAMTVTITNSPPLRASELAASGSGMGLDGLRRRVTLLGGSLTATETPDGGFHVAATLPASVPTDSPETTDAPETTDTPKTTNAPETTNGPETTDVPESTARPKSTDDLETT